MALLQNPADRDKRKSEKRQQLLRWLRVELFTNLEIAGLLWGVKGAAINKTIATLEREGVVTTHLATLESGRRIQIVGITTTGQALAFDPATESPESKYFEPSRLPLSVIDHTFDLQKIRLRCERAGWRSWQYGDRGKIWTKGVSRPDAITITTAGEVVALEVERTIKTLKRYEVVIADRLRMIKQGAFSRVIYTSPTPELSTALAAVISKVESVPIAGTRVRLEERHRASLLFTTYDNLIESA